MFRSRRPPSMRYWADRAMWEQEHFVQTIVFKLTQLSTTGRSERLSIETLQGMNLTLQYDLMTTSESLAQSPSQKAEAKTNLTASQSTFMSSFSWPPMAAHAQVASVRPSTHPSLSSSGTKNVPLTELPLGKKSTAAADE